MSPAVLLFPFGALSFPRSSVGMQTVITQSQQSSNEHHHLFFPWSRSDLPRASIMCQQFRQICIPTQEHGNEEGTMNDIHEYWN